MLIEVFCHRMSHAIQVRRLLLPSIAVVFITFLLLTWHLSLAISGVQLGTTSAKLGKSFELHDAVSGDPFDPALFDLEGAFDGSAIRKVCDGIAWREGLYFDCSNNSGGLGNERSFILTCIRYAIEAGAYLVMPTIRKRDPNNLGELFTTNEPFSYMFDEEFFIDSIETYCPQMHIAKNRDTIPNFSKVGKLMTEVVPRDMGNHQDNDGSGFDVNRWAGTFRDDFDWWLANATKLSPTLEQPVVVVFRWATFFDWPIYIDGPHFSNTFGRLLKLPRNVITLATEVIRSLAAIDPAILDAEQYGGPLLNYLGMHLRTEADRLDWWPDENAQIDAYVERIKTLHLQSKTVYLATGSSSGVQRVRERLATEVGARVVSKETILNGSVSLTHLQSLPWDQQALVDYCVLLRSRDFLGMFQSSFAQNIAVRRHLLDDGAETLIWRGYYDKWSFLFGSRKRYTGDWVFFSAETMWP